MSTSTLLRDRWYVAAAASEVCGKHLARRLLDAPVVLARMDDGALLALEDACPHRRAPLSLGRLTSRGLRCGYHGLEFDALGECVAAPFDSKIPSLARLRRYPVAERYGWI
jgi:vanillate O-demethylase monooxygenase subunit